MRAQTRRGDAGLEASAGSGSAVKAGVPRRPLSRGRIVAAALRLVDERGLPQLTVRALGEALGCEAMSVYHHFPSKQHLLDALVEQAIAGVPEPPPGFDAFARLRFLGIEYRAIAHRHRQLLPLIALHRFNTPAGVAFIERLLRHFRDAVPDDRLAAQAFRVFGYYVIGAALGEAYGCATGSSAAPSATEARVPQECPHLVVAAPYFDPPFTDSTFNLGFEMMMDGIAALRAKALAQSGSAPKPVIHPKR